MKNVRNTSELQKQSDWKLINKHGSPSQQHRQYKHLKVNCRDFPSDNAALPNNTGSANTFR